MSTRSLLVLLVLLASAGVPVHAAPPTDPALANAVGRGEPLDRATIDLIDRTVFPDGSGLPPGSGTVAAGEALYADRCAVCHGPAGRGASAPEL
ncbi:MAG: c-type cytochrome, partial [Gammaproteobacteria bacterium]|nr:c-type cytochrome [Gammaproteobacteria bacterium]